MLPSPRSKSHLLLATLAVAAIAPASAMASPPCQCAMGWTLPASGAVAVPTNARIVLGDAGVDPAKLSLHAGDAAIAATASQLSPGVVALVPDAPLTVQTAYQVREALADGTSRVALSFTTGDVPDATAPAVGTIALRPGRLDGACEEHIAAVIDAPPASGAADEAWLLAVTLDGPTGQRVVHVTSWWPYLGDSSRGGAGWETCLANVPGADPSKVYTATVVAVDVAGNASAPQGPLSFRFGVAQAAGASCSGGPVSPGVAAMRLAILAAGLAAYALRRMRP